MSLVWSLEFTRRNCVSPSDYSLQPLEQTACSRRYFIRPVYHLFVTATYIDTTRTHYLCTRPSCCYTTT